MKDKDLLINTILGFGFIITARDGEYYRFKYYNREEGILVDNSVNILDEKILIEIDFDEQTTRIKSSLTNENGVMHSADNRYHFVPTVPGITDLLEEEYALEATIKFEEGGTRTESNEE